MANNRAAYGLAKKYGIDTTGMTIKEVWDAVHEKERTLKSYTKEKNDKQQAKKLNDAVDIYSGDPEKDRKEMRENGTIPTPKNRFRSSSPKEFHSALEAVKETFEEEERWRVELHPAEEYENVRRFIADDGGCVAIEPGGNIISLCKNNSKKTGHVSGSDLIKKAVQEGGDRLDAFGGLYGFYIKNGFEPVSYTPFSRNAAPHDWKPKFGEEGEPVIFYKYTGKNTTLLYDDFIADKSHCFEGENGYEEAMKFRDENMKTKAKR